MCGAGKDRIEKGRRKRYWEEGKREGSKGRGSKEVRK